MNPLNLIVFILAVCLIVGIVVTLVPWVWLQVVLGALGIILAWRWIVDPSGRIV